MNLELLGSSGETIPDRIDATLQLPYSLHTRKKKSGKEAGGASSNAANCIAFNRRGSYAAVGYESGTIAVYDLMSRTLAALYRKVNSGGDKSNTSSDQQPKNPNSTFIGVSLLSWSRRSRCILAGTTGHADLQFIDTTHPYGPEECAIEKKKDEKDKESSKGEDDESFSKEKWKDMKANPAFSCFKEHREAAVVHHRCPGRLGTQILESKEGMTIPDMKRRPVFRSHTPVKDSSLPRFPILTFSLPQPLGRSLEIHPRDTCAGIATLSDGSIAAFCVPADSWSHDVTESQPPKAKVTIVCKIPNIAFTCATFDPSGDRVYAANEFGNLLGFEVGPVFDAMVVPDSNDVPSINPAFQIHVPGGASITHLRVSRNGEKIIVNSADAAIRLYLTKECWMTPEEVDKPVWVLQNTEPRLNFTSCDFSGNGDMILGVTCAPNAAYQLFLWDATTGDLRDRLAGAYSEIHDIAWHPTRSFLAAAAADGLVDIWGPCVNWTSFAPDFQALTENIEYVECEDEFDITQKTERPSPDVHEISEDENEDVDVISIEQVAAFASDSEPEDEIFRFETKIKPCVAKDP